MSIIDPDGLFNGERLRQCSNIARLYWPYFFLASNGHGRLEIDYHRLVAKAFSSFKPVPTEVDLMACIREYFESHLIFLYRAGNGGLWGQWDCRSQLLNKYKTAADNRSPTPPESEFSAWKESYKNGNKSIPASLRDISEVFPKASHEVPEQFPQSLPSGIGNGVGGGKKSTSEPRISDRRRETPVNQAEPSEEAQNLASLLRKRILENNPKAKITAKQFSKWAVEADRMMRLDKRTAEEVRDLINWSQADMFWSKNILSMTKLREQFDQLTVRRKSKQKQNEGEYGESEDYKPNPPRWPDLSDSPESGDQGGKEI